MYWKVYTSVHRVRPLLIVTMICKSVTLNLTIKVNYFNKKQKKLFDVKVK